MPGDVFWCRSSGIYVSSSTDGPTGLNCDNNGNAAYSTPDTIPGACAWTSITPMCETDCTVDMITEYHQDDLPNCIGGGICK